MDQSQLSSNSINGAPIGAGSKATTKGLSAATSLPPHSAANYGRFTEDFNAERPATRAGLEPEPEIQRTNSAMSQSHTLTPSRSGTLKKRQSLKKSNSLRRSSSRKSLTAGSVRSLALGDREKYGDEQENQLSSAFYTPIPTAGNPTEVLANRFQAWRKVLKDLLTYFREIQKSYEAKSKSVIAAANVINNMVHPPMFLADGGIGAAASLLRQYHKQSMVAAQKAKTLEDEVIQQLAGLRSDLQQKIKEIKNLSGDFKNSVDKEMEVTRRAVNDLQEALGLVDTAPGATVGKGDPFVVKLGVERQIEKQIDEENYLHRAFLNLENSGRELESIVVGEIQKAYNVYAGILKREADEAHEVVEALQSGPIAMPKDTEWVAFVHEDENFVDPRIPIRRASQVGYPGQNAPAAMEVRAGMLERKSKYLKSYTPGWYVLSPTHLHEFKSPDRLHFQTPVMSLYLPEQKLGSRSSDVSSSHKFMLKGRQTGPMHRGHGWVFRAESQDTMLAWYEDIKNLTEKTGEERNAFVRQHARSMSAGSIGGGSSDGAMDEDEADRTPFSATTPQLDPVPAAAAAAADDAQHAQRPQPGGRFPSDLTLDRNLRVPLSPSSGTSSDEHDVNTVAAAAVPKMGSKKAERGGQAGLGVEGMASRGQEDGDHQQQEGSASQLSGPLDSAAIARQPAGGRIIPGALVRPDSHYGEWMAPAASSTAKPPVFAQDRSATEPLSDATASPPAPAAASNDLEHSRFVPTPLSFSSDLTDETISSSATASPPTKRGATASDLHVPGEFPHGSRTSTLTSDSKDI